MLSGSFICIQKRRAM